MDTHLLLEEMRLLQQRDQRRQSLLAHMASSGSSNYPMSSAAAFLGGLSSTASTNAALLELHQKLYGPGALGNLGSSNNGLASVLLGGAHAGLLGGDAHVSSGSSYTSAVLAAAAAPSSLSTANMSNEELLRAIAVAGIPHQSNSGSSLLRHSSPTLNAVTGATANATLPASFLNSLVSAAEANIHNETGAERKRGGESPGLSATSASNEAATRTATGDSQLASNKRQRLMSHDDPAAAAVHVLASAAAEMERKQAQVDATTRGKLSPEGNSFPLPSEKDTAKTTSSKKALGMPKLTSFRAGWDNIKTKELQKEIFLRKLHQGKWASK